MVTAGKIGSTIILATVALSTLAGCVDNFVTHSQIEESTGCALCNPAFEGNLPQVALLLQRGANVNAKDPASGYAPLYYGIDKGNSDIVLLLLQHHADPNVVGRSGMTPLMIAAGGWADPILVQALIQAGANVNAANDDGNTALHFATIGFSRMPRTLAVTQALIAAHANPNTKNKDGHTPLFHLAFLYPLAFTKGTPRSDDLAAIKLLLSAGANAKDQSAISEALVTGYLDDSATAKLVPDANVIWLLLAYGADISGINNPLPMDTLAARHVATAAAVFINAGAKIDQENPDGDTALNLAVRRDDLAHTQTLLRLGANPIHRDSRGQYPLQVAKSHSNEAISRQLVQYGAAAIPQSGQKTEADGRHIDLASGE